MHTYTQEGLLAAVEKVWVRISAQLSALTSQTAPVRFGIRKTTKVSHLRVWFLAACISCVFFSVRACNMRNSCNY
jgi:hypothetical protein